MSDEYAYSTDNPAIVAAYRETRDALAAYGERMKVDCAALGVHLGPLVYRGIFGTPDRIVGLVPDVNGTIPDGWRLVRHRLEPRRGKPGDNARKWLADHQPPDMRHVMREHGLPRHSRMPGNGTGYRMITPALFEHEGTVWACYQGKPGGDFLSDNEQCTWTPRKLSEFHAAREAVEAAHEVVAGSAR